MEPSKDVPKAARPLSRSISFGCILFILILCVILGMVSYSNYRTALYSHCESYLSDLLTYIDTKIDDDDLSQCIRTGVRSTRYDELEAFMDAVKEDFDVHYLYILKPLNTDASANMMYVLTAENDYDRNVDTEGNLALGDISGNEYDSRTAALFLNVMKQKEIVFFEDISAWGKDYTAAFPLYDSSRTAYAVLAADIELTNIKTLIWRNTIESAILVILFGAVFTMIFLFWANRDIVKPLKNLEKVSFLLPMQATASVISACWNTKIPRSTRTMKLRFSPVRSQK